MKTWMLKVCAQTMRVWYGVTQLVSGIGGVPVVGVPSLAEHVIRIAYGTRYKKDRKIGAMMHPRRVMKWVNTPGHPIGDCEDHGSLWIATLLKGGFADRVWFGTLYMKGKGGAWFGHHVTVFVKDGEYYWADYDMPTPIPTRQAWVESVPPLYEARSMGGILFEAGLSKHERVTFGAAEYYPA